METESTTLRKTIALTGATGFVGTATVEAALAAGYHVRALTRRDQPARDGVTWIAGSLEDRDALVRLCEGAETVLHIAGVVNSDAEGFERGNVQGTVAMVDAAKAAGTQRFVHVSSLAAREPDLSLYGASKARAERIVATSLLDWTIVRPPAVFGPGDAEMLDLFKMAKRGVVMLPPTGRFSAIHVFDLAQLLVALAPSREETRGVTYEADDGQDGAWEHRGFGQAIGRALGKSVRTIATPRALLTMAAAGDRFWRKDKAKLTADRVNYLCHPDWTIDPAKRPPETIWTPRVDTAEGLKATADWYRAKGWL